jgi:hypothetical protein
MRLAAGFSTRTGNGNPYNAAPWNSQNVSASIYGVWGTH